MNSIDRRRLDINRRHFFRNASRFTLGTAALASIETGSLMASPGLAGIPHHRPTVKRVIYLFQSGAPSQLDLFDWKPNLKEQFDKDLPDSVRMGQRLTGMTSGQKRFPVAPTKFKFGQHGQSGQWISELLPHLSSMADDLCIIKSMSTEAINHDPAITFFQTGSQTVRARLPDAELGSRVDGIIRRTRIYVRSLWTGF